jgi:hypothetical protein
MYVVFGCALALSLVFVPAAVAANPAPNSGFENYCDPPGAPCNWVGGERDEVNPHTGAASLRTFVNELTVIERAFSDCVTASLPSGPRAFSLWYRTGDSRINGVYGSVSFFSDTTCSSASGFGYIEQAATANGSWQPAATTVQVPANVQSMSFALGAAGGVRGGDPPAPINFDDILLGSPTAVVVASFTAVRRPGGVRLSWGSASEVGVIGYRVLREGPQGRTLVRGLIRTALGVRSASYRVVDRTASTAFSYGYTLQAVGLDGAWHAVRSARVAAG